MGQIVLPSSGPVYVDTNAVIYFVENIEPYRTASLPLWQALNAKSIQAVTSYLTLLEVLVKPFREGNHALVTFYRNFLSHSVGLSQIPIDGAVLEAAAQVRAHYHLRTPDAIHAASALQAACSQLVTNDPGFRCIPGLPVAILSEIAAS